MCGDGRRPSVRASVGMPIDKIYSEPRPDEASANNILTKLMDVTTRPDFCNRVLAHLHVSACATIVRINKCCVNTMYCICILTCGPRFPMFTRFDIDERDSDFMRPYGCRCWLISEQDLLPKVAKAKYHCSRWFCIGLRERMTFVNLSGYSGYPPSSWKSLSCCYSFCSPSSIPAIIPEPSVSVLCFCRCRSPTPPASPPCQSLLTNSRWPAPIYNHEIPRRLPSRLLLHVKSWHDTALLRFVYLAAIYTNETPREDCFLDSYSMWNYDLARLCVDYLTWPRSILTRLPGNCLLDSYRLWNHEVRDCVLSSIPSTININVTPLKAVLLIPAGFWREDITCICVLISDLRFLFTQTIPLLTISSWFL